MTERAFQQAFLLEALRRVVGKRMMEIHTTGRRATLEERAAADRALRFDRRNASEYPPEWYTMRNSHADKHRLPTERCDGVEHERRRCARVREAARALASTRKIG